MAAPHFFAEPLEEGTSVLLSTEDSRHALRSLRLRQDDVVTLADGHGQWADGVVLGEREGLAAVEVVGVRFVPRPDPSLSVALAPPKGDRLNWAVQKLAELGVDEVLLMRTERSVRTWGPEEVSKVEGRLRAVAREAAMQSRQPYLMDVRGGCSFEDALRLPGGTVVMLYERGSPTLSEALPNNTWGVRLLVGPEGGFTESEFEAAGDAGAWMVGMGPSILRTETAAIVGAGLVLARYGRLG